MEILQAHELFARRKDRSQFPFDAILAGNVDCWPAACVAGVSLSGCLDDACTDDDLNEGLEHFGYLIRDGIIDGEAWKEKTAEVIDAVLAWGYAGELAAAETN